jgi:hypothetical protein
MNKAGFSKALWIIFCTVIIGVLTNALAAQQKEPGTVPGVQKSLAAGPVVTGAPSGLNIFYQYAGKLYLSVDGAGDNEASHVIQVQKPSKNAKVRKAFVLAACTGTVIQKGDVTMNGKALTWSSSCVPVTPSYPGLFYNTLADVTAIVKPIMDKAPVGRKAFTFVESLSLNGSIEGEVLAVVFDDPAQTLPKMVSLLFGGINQGGDHLTISLAKPVDPLNPGVVADMGLGISFSSQGGGEQYFIVDVNGSRLSTSAGGNDDGIVANGGLITVGGLDDSRANPPDSYHVTTDNAYDDEFYSLLPFIHSTDSKILVETQSTSEADNLFFAYFVVNSGAGVNTDTDGDGLLDEWEKYGYDADNDGVVDVNLPAMGADYKHKDIFVEVDWMTGHKPLAEGMANVVAAFKSAPVKNPDKKTGITIHIDTGEFGGGNEVPHDANLSPVWTEFDAIKAANFDDKRSAIFHYCLFAHDYEGTTSSGISRDIPASDFIVSLGSWDYGTGTMKQQAGTFMHELGHNLGLKHGGNDHVGYKPNFLSIMNYFFQMDWLRYKKSDQKLDYSRFDIKSLNENALNESKALDRVGGDTPIALYGTRYIDATPYYRLTDKCTSNVDWNGNGSSKQPNVAVDLNYDGAKNTLTGNCEEWSIIVFTGGSVGSGGRPIVRVAPAPEPDLTLDKYRWMLEHTIIID